jgi:hypothetical protein
MPKHRNTYPTLLDALSVFFFNGDKAISGDGCLAILITRRIFYYVNLASISLSISLYAKNDYKL